ncbi:hypothetical protein HanIR_Chr10g0481721 [Helianthus annuus]|nr:hypothetical protein HanIR_Chr10g0481721 [Helianthus annuus]
MKEFFHDIHFPIPKILQNTNQIIFSLSLIKSYGQTPPIQHTFSNSNFVSWRFMFIQFHFKSI